MNVEVIVYQDEQPQEDGATLRPWRAESATHAVGAQGETPEGALYEFARWLKLSLDDDNDVVPHLESTGRSSTARHSQVLVYKPATEKTRRMFEHGEAYDLKDIPAEWDVRIYRKG